MSDYLQEIIKKRSEILNIDPEARDDIDIIIDECDRIKALAASYKADALNFDEAASQWRKRCIQRDMQLIEYQRTILKLNTAISSLVGALRSLGNPNNYDVITDDDGEITDMFVWSGEDRETCFHPWDYAAKVYKEELGNAQR